ncbi:TPA: MFS transporter [Candidatus Micrarchaeota archaeon]|nr:MAG: hypothetical protein AUJ65_01845 [Candidatus Micrarchaeota archaeon CG1_02_51_15]HII38585.1 MFS transporter [Candidatus Micrarchaeota archaeon]
MHKTIKTLIAIDVGISAGIGLTAPLFALFVTEQIAGASVVEVGIATALFWLVKSILQIPVATYTDRQGVYKKFLAGGTLLMALVLFGYAFATNVTQIYALQVLDGLATALVTPAWMALFSRNLSKGKEGFEWSVYQTTSGIATAATAAIGGALVATTGFRNAYLLVSAVVLAGAAAYAATKPIKQPALHYYSELKKQLEERRLSFNKSKRR